MVLKLGGTLQKHPVWAAVSIEAALSNIQINLSVTYISEAHKILTKSGFPENKVLRWNCCKINFGPFWVTWDLFMPQSGGKCPQIAAQ